MDKPGQAAVEALTREVRRAFHALKEAADELHRDLGITAAMRGVMESLSEGGPQSVPEIARDKSVTRQHIQQIANALIEAGLIETLPNPRHQTSPLLALTRRGGRAFADVRKRETQVFAEAARALRDVDLDQAADALRALSAHLQRRTK
jgi:DNA-binding MarR family transcriptional regulator